MKYRIQAIKSDSNKKTFHYAQLKKHWFSSWEELFVSEYTFRDNFQGQKQKIKHHFEQNDKRMNPVFTYTNIDPNDL